MGMFYDVYCEHAQDAARLESQLRCAEAEEAGGGAANPIHFEVCGLAPDESAMREEQLGHPVARCVAITVHLCRNEEAGDRIVDAVARSLLNLKGAVSLTTYGERLLARWKPNVAVELFEADHFWNPSRRRWFESDAQTPLVVEAGRKWLE